jgi:hypothetical protein
MRVSSVRSADRGGYLGHTVAGRLNVRSDKGRVREHLQPAYARLLIREQIKLRISTNTLVYTPASGDARDRGAVSATALHVAPLSEGRKHAATRRVSVRPCFRACFSAGGADAGSL